MPMHSYYWGGGDLGRWMLVHGALWLLLLALGVIGAIMLTRRSGTTGPGSALDLLNERYARGEIDREEYLQRKKDILAR